MIKYYIKFKLKTHRGIIECVDGYYDTYEDAYMNISSIKRDQNVYGEMEIIQKDK